MIAVWTKQAISRGTHATPQLGNVVCFCIEEFVDIEAFFGHDIGVPVIHHTKQGDVIMYEGALGFPVANRVEKIAMWFERIALLFRPKFWWCFVTGLQMAGWQAPYMYGYIWNFLALDFAPATRKLVATQLGNSCMLLRTKTNLGTEQPYVLHEDGYTQAGAPMSALQILFYVYMSAQWGNFLADATEIIRRRKGKCSFHTMS